MTKHAIRILLLTAFSLIPLHSVKSTSGAEIDRARLLDPLNPPDQIVDSTWMVAEPAAPAGLPSQVAFVGNQLVDLHWTPPADTSPYALLKIYRDGIPILVTTRLTRDFLRDQDSLTKGSEVKYKICYVKSADLEEDCGSENVVTLGEVQGEILKDMTWEGGTYRLYDYVNVAAGAALRITNNTFLTNTLSSGGYLPAINQHGSGTVQMDGAVLMIRLYLVTHASWVRNSRTSGDQAQIMVSSNSILENNLFRTGSSLAVTSLSKAQILNNRFYNNAITTLYLSAPTIERNTFYHAAVEVRNDSQPLIINNTFEGTPQYSGNIFSTAYTPVTVRQNEFTMEEDPYWYAVNLAHDSPHVIEGNTFEGNQAHARPTGGEPVAIVISSMPEACAGKSQIRGNSIEGWGGGIWLGGYASSHWANNCAQVFGNTIVENVFGVVVDGDGDYSVGSNCISANFMKTYPTFGAGLDLSSRTETLDAANNYWGHPSGPTHPSHPDGRGDRISGDPVDFSPYLESHACSELDLRVGEMEIVQVVQDVSNSVYQVAGKPTVARIYPETNKGKITNVKLTLKGYQGEELLGTLGGDLPGMTAEPITNLFWTRSRENSGWIVPIPEDWLSGTVRFVAEVSSNAAEMSTANNSKTTTVTFYTQNQLKIAYVPIRYQPEPDQSSTPILSSIPNLSPLIKKIYPTNSFSMRILPEEPWTKRMKGSSDEAARAKQLLQRLAAIQARRPNEQIVGIMPGSHGETISFCTADPKWGHGSGIASYCDYDPESVAHEIGHNFGLKHVATSDSCGSESKTTDWPHQDASIQEFGYDPLAKEIKHAAECHDIMSYCPGHRDSSQARPGWISPFHYMKLFNSNLMPQAASDHSVSPSSSGPHLMIGGRVTDEGVVTFNPIWELGEVGTAITPPEGDQYCLELRSSGDGILADACFDLDFYLYETDQQMDADYFLVTLPKQPGAAKVVLLEGEAELAEVVASSNPPTVTLIAPNGGESLSGSTTVSWTGSDPDGDALSYNLYFSPDSGSIWIPAGMGIGEQSYELDLGLIPGGSNSLIKVEASDGFHTASDVSDSAFDVAGKSPLVSISDPAGGSAARLPITFQGTAYDPEDGLLSGGSLSWHSDIDGRLGEGEILPVAILSEGQHVITLTAVDSQMGSSSASITITIQPLLRVYLPLLRR